MGVIDVPEYVEKVSIPLIKQEFDSRDWAVVEWDIRIGYIEFEYAGVLDSSRIILFRNWYDRDSWNRNEWKVLFKITPVVGSLSYHEIELVQSLMTALKLMKTGFTAYDDLFESDHDNIEEQKEYIKYILGEDS